MGLGGTAVQGSALCSQAGSVLGLLVLHVTSSANSAAALHMIMRESCAAFLARKDRLPHMRTCMWEEYTKEWDDSESLEKQNVAAD